MCSTAVYFYESCSILASLQSKIQRTSKNIQQYYTLKCLIRYLLFNCHDSEFCKQLNKKNAGKARGVTSVMEYFDWLKKPVNQVPSLTELTIIYSKVVVTCGCHSFPKPVKNPVFHCTISLYICTRYLDVARRYLDVAKVAG